MKNNNNKGAFMSLPFLAGIAAGALGVLAWNKKDKLLKLASDEIQKGKEFVGNAYEKSKNETKNIIQKTSKSSTTTRAKKTAQAKK